MTLLEKLNELLLKGSSAEDIQSALGQFMIPKGEFNKVNDENKTLKSKVANLETNVGDLNSEIETARTANMDEQELMKHQLEQAQGKIKSHAIEKNRLTAENKFVGAGFQKEEYEALLEKIVSDDDAHTMGLVDSFLSLTKSKVDGAKTGVVDDLLKNNLTPPKGDALNNEVDDIDSLIADFNSDLD